MIRDSHERYVDDAEQYVGDKWNPVAQETRWLRDIVEYPHDFDFNDLIEFRKRHTDAMKLYAFPGMFERVVALRNEPVERRVLAAIYDRLCGVRDRINLTDDERELLCRELLQTLIDVSRVLDDNLDDNIARRKQCQVIRAARPDLYGDDLFAD